MRWSYGRLAILLMGLLAASARPAFAQVHPCDVVVAQNPSVQNPYRVQFCSDLLDSNGVAIEPATVSVRLAIDGVSQAVRSMPAPLGVQSATGDVLYEIGGLVSAKGPHSITVALVTVDGEGVSLPFAYAVRGKAPKPPVTRVVQ